MPISLPRVAASLAAAFIASLLATPALAAQASAATRAKTPAKAPTKAQAYDATVRWTSFGIPHVKANDWASLGYGYAYATAQDAVCTIARDVITVNGAQSQHLGPAEGRLESDVFHRAILDNAAVARFTRRQTVKSNAFSRGYANGYNRWLRDHRTRMPAACRDVAWVAPITAQDVARLTMGVGIRYGLGIFQRQIATATPPVVGPVNPGASKDAGDGRLALDATLVSAIALPAGIGSNAVAMGKAVTASGRGLLLGNPHYPWQGASRFHLIHVTLPGEVDVMGVSLYTTSRVTVGFNKDVAWTHTVSTGTRYSLYALELDSTNATRYRYGSGWRDMTSRRVTVPVKGADGSVAGQSRTVWFSHHGPILALSAGSWNARRTFAVRDANSENDGSAATYDALNRARNIDEVEGALNKQGTSWVNTIAADRNGTVYYADLSTVPNMDAGTMARCRVQVQGFPPGLAALNGADPSCEWTTSPTSVVPGAMPPSSMPRLRRDDVVSNANDSHWLTNPAAPLEGYSPMVGPERTPRSLRTRAGLAFIDEALAGGKKVTAQTLQDMLFSHRNYGAELLLDTLLTLCTAPVEPVVMTTSSAAGSATGSATGSAASSVAGAPVDITPSCKALSAWDRRETVASRGAQVWRETWRIASRVPGVFRVPFDTNDAARTPRGLAVDQPAVREGLRRAIAGAQQRLAQNGVALDAPLGSIQYVERNGERIGIPGGEGQSGMWSVISSELRPGGYNAISTGNSYIQVVGWTADGRVEARGLITYSQSDHADSPHHADMTRLYSRGEWMTLPFHERDIIADKSLRTVRLRQ